MPRQKVGKLARQKKEAGEVDDRLVALIKSKLPIILIAVVVGVGFSIMHAMRTPKATDNNAGGSSFEVPIRVSSAKLIKEYQANELAADEKYRGKLLEVAGTVYSVNRDIADEPYVVLSDNPYGLPAAEVKFPKELLNNSDLKDLRKGTPFDTFARCEGMFATFVMLRWEQH
jgi:hypothetical protein